MLLTHLNLLATSLDGVARLRELILTLAVQGKLVPQDPKDEPASELLKKIRAEKDRLIAEGKIKRDKTLPEIADEEKPSLPVGWAWVPLQHVGYTQTGTTPDKKNPEFYGTHIPFIKPGDIYPRFVDYGNEGLSERGLNDSGRVAPSGSILMVCIGTIGKTNIIDRDCSFNQQINSITPLCCVPEFLSLYLRCPEFQSVAWARSSSTTISILNKGNWEEVPVVLPPLAEQSRIVTRVEELMRLCDALEAKARLETTQHAQLVATLLATLTASTTPEELADNWQRVATHFDLLLDRPEAVDALEQTILQLAVRGLLVPQDPADEPANELLKKIRTEKDRLITAGKIKRDKPLPPIVDEEKPFELPPGWEWVRLNSLLQKIGAGSTPLGGREVYVPSGVKFLRSQNVWDDGLRLDRVAFIKPETHAKMAGTVVVANDLLFNITGASIGRCTVVPSDFDEGNVSQHVTIVRTVLPELNAFLHKVLISRHVQQAVMDVQVGVSREGLSIAKLGHFLIPVPPPAEQSRIVSRVAALHALCAQLRKKLTDVRNTQSQLAEALVETVA